MAFIPWSIPTLLWSFRFMCVGNEIRWLCEPIIVLGTRNWPCDLLDRKVMLSPMPATHLYFSVLLSFYSSNIWRWYLTMNNSRLALSNCMKDTASCANEKHLPKVVYCKIPQQSISSIKTGFTKWHERRSLVCNRWTPVEGDSLSSTTTSDVLILTMHGELNSV